MATLNPPNALLSRNDTAFRLFVFDRLGKVRIAEFSRTIPGIEDGLMASYDALAGCGGLSFKGRPDLMQLVGGEVLQAFVDDGDGLRPVFYGALETGATSDPTETTVSYTASATELLNGYTCDEQIYEGVDVADAAKDLTLRRRHPALKHRESNFPATGIILDEPYSAPTLPLGKALEELAARAAESGLELAYGVDEEGYVFFRPNLDELVLGYYEGMFKDLPTTVPGGITTAVHWLIGGQPSVDQWAGGYKPSTLTYISVPDETLHAEHQKLRPRTAPESAWVAVANGNYTQSGFSNPASAVDSNTTTAASRTASSGTPYFRLTNNDPMVLGIRLLYSMSADVPPVKLRITPVHRSGTGQYFEIELPKSEGELKPVDIKLPPAYNQRLGWFDYFSTFNITVPVGGTFDLYQAHLLRVDTGRLDAMTRRLIVVPALRPSQIAPKRQTPTGLRGYIVPKVGSSVLVRGSPFGDLRGAVAAVRRGWSDKGEAETVIDLGTPSGDEDALLMDQIALEAERKLNESELKNAMRRKL